jgi:uncharacterized repeat protein (TIGR02543 family)
MPTNNVVVTASWNAIQYSISYTLNGGSNGAGNPSTYNAGNLPITLTNPTRTGYAFLGWTVKYADGSQTDVTTPVLSYSIPSGATGNIALTANWDQQFTVQFVNWDGTLLKSETVSYGKNATPPANPTSAGYVFTGWDGDFTNVTKDLKITALYRPTDTSDNTQSSPSTSTKPNSSNNAPNHSNSAQQPSDNNNNNQSVVNSDIVKDITDALTIIAGAIAGIYFKITGWLMGLLGF